MARKEKEIIWHKRRSKFLPASIEKARTSPAGRDASPAMVSRRQQFEQDLMKKIRAVVRRPSKEKSVS